MLPFEGLGNISLLLRLSSFNEDIPEQFIILGVNPALDMAVSKSPIPLTGHISAFFSTISGPTKQYVGYAAGFTPNATYEEVCSGLTGHNEVVQVIYAKSEVSLEMLLKVFWENHDPTQGMRQGYDRGTQYRSGIYFSDQEDLEKIEILRDKYQSNLSRNSYGEITTEIKEISNFYFAEDYHQQYLAKNPNGYCGHGGCGISLED